MFRPAGYYSSSEDSDDDDLEAFGRKHGLTKEAVAEKAQENVLSLLLTAVQQGNVERTVGLITDNNLQVDTLVYQDWTPLMLAASSGYLELTKSLIELGADVHQLRDLETVLMNACKVSSINVNFSKVIEIVQLLIENKCDANMKNAKRMTAFHYAAKNGNIDVLKFLRNHCDTDALDNQGWNALFYAVDGNHFRTVRYLLRMGMDYKKHDVRRNTPLIYARRNGLQKIEELMPDDEALEKKYETYLGETYSFRDEMAGPRFMRDVNIMLYGMHSSSLLPKFHEDPTMNLCKFLTLTQDDLHAMDITKPYQVNRILGGLYQFHGHPYKFQSLGHGSKHSILSTYDIGFSLFGILRHYITMQATLKYLRLNVKEFDDKIVKDLTQLEETLHRTRKLIKALKQRSASWEKENEPVDLITFPEKKKTNKIYIFLPIVTAISIVFYFKFRL